MDTDDRLADDPVDDTKKEPKNATIDLKTLLKGDLAGMITGVVYSVTTLPFDRTGDSAKTICGGTALAIVIFRIGSALIDLYKKVLNASSGTHYEALQTERRHHLDCRETNIKIYAEIARVEKRLIGENTRIQEEFASYIERHANEYETLRSERDNYKSGYDKLLADLYVSSGNRPRDPDSDPKASVFDAGQGGNPGRGGQ